MSQPTLDETAIAAQVKVQQMRVFRDRWMRGAQTAPLAMVFIGWIIYLSAGWQRALAWAGLMATIELVVYGIGWCHRRADAAQADTRSWLLALVATCLLAGAGWGSSIWFGWMQTHFMLYLINLCVLVGVAGAAVLIGAPHPLANPLFLLGLMLPLLAHIVWIESSVGLQIFAGWGVLSVVYAVLSSDHRRELLLQLDATERNRQLVEMLSLAQAELQRSTERLRSLVNVDQLTGAYTRRYIFEHLERQLAQFQRHGTLVSIIMLDLDHFKQINDNHGHPTGDRALIAAALAVRSQLREGDLLARVGGEEFLVLLPMTGQKDAMQLAERLRNTLNQIELTEGDTTIVLSASFGVAELRTGDDLSGWYNRTDAAMYQAKHQGRNSTFGAV